MSMMNLVVREVTAPAVFQHELGACPWSTARAVPSRGEEAHFLAGQLCPGTGLCAGSPSWWGRGLTQAEGTVPSIAWTADSLSGRDQPPFPAWLEGTT